jgi:hypothetical protein
VGCATPAARGSGCPSAPPATDRPRRARWWALAGAACAIALACAPRSAPAPASPPAAAATTATSWTPVHEIAIPAGTQARLDTGESVEVLETQIRVKVGESVRIRNDDIVDHVIGPYYLQAGAALQQTYRAPQTIEFVCFVNPDKAINLIVEPN